MSAVVELGFELPELRRPPIRYHGSKWRMAPWLIGLMPSHNAYVEPFGGGGSVLLRKPRSRIEVYNDLDGQIVNFWRVLRDPDTRDRLIAAVELTPFAREEFELAYEPTADSVEAARRLLVRCYGGHGTCSIDPTDSNGFRSCDIRAGKSYAREWMGVPASLVAAAERFRGVTLEHRPAIDLIGRFDDPDTLFYCDPPYLPGVRDAGGKGYVHEMSRRDHEALCWVLCNLKARVMVSGYPSELYDGILAGWNRREKPTTANGQVGAVPRTEVVWMNF